MFIKEIILICLLSSGYVSKATPNWWKKSHKQEEERDDGKNKNINNISINTTVNSSASAQIVDTVVSAVKEEVKQIKEQVSASVEMLTLITKELLWEYKWRLGFIGTAGGYGFIVIKNQQLKTYITHPLRWHFWALTHLTPRLFRQDITNQDLTWQLIREIQSRYTSAQQPDDFILPFMQFLKDIEEEIRALKSYKRLGDMFEYLGISNYIFFDQTTYKKCATWLKEAETIKTLFLCWMADYKLQQHTRSLRLQFLLERW